MNLQRPESYSAKQVPESVASESASAPQLMVTDILTRAANLARKGDLRQAENLLKTLSDIDYSRIEVIDLSAKIYAQQGKFEQAQGLWIKALEKDPSNLHVLAALRMCAYYRRPGSEPPIFQYSWLWIIIVLWFIIAMTIIIGL